MDCYDIDEDLYDKLARECHKRVNVRSEILFESNFMVQNQINTYSKLYQKKQVFINEKFDEIDNQEFQYLLDHNHFLE